ncbi:MAG: hypothetical protein ACYTKD_26440 [Planctomycetota bacterium]|jgi:hypothetical protein
MADANATTVEATDISRGLRHDPMRWVGADRSPEGARVRREVFGRPAEGDEAILRAKADEIIAEQESDGGFGDESKETGAKLLEILRLGVPHERDEVRRAAGAILSHSGEVLSIYALHALCLLGMKDEPEVQRSLRLLCERQDEWNDANQGCPWTPEVFWSALWVGRGIVPAAEQAVRDGLRRITEGMNAAGCNSYNHPWGLTDAAGGIDAPEARALVEKQLPMILRGQRADGGWDGSLLAVLRALKTHGLLERLTELPALEADWRVVREVALPEGKWGSLAWDGEAFWSFDHARGAAARLSPDDGRELASVKMENCGAVAWWEGALATTGTEPKELRRVDARTGEVLLKIPLDFVEWLNHPVVVEGKVLVGDGFNGGVWTVDPERPDQRRFTTLGAPIPLAMCPEGRSVWHADIWAPAIVRSDVEGRLLDWGEKPFGVAGLAHDGERLWALHGAKRRLCVIEKAGGAA